MATPKEKIYDEQIAPLVGQIHAICEQHKIAGLMSFCLGTDPDHNGDELSCTTALLSEEYEPDSGHLKALMAIYRTKPTKIVDMLKDGRPSCN
jgi:hypothetical protein